MGFPSRLSSENTRVLGETVHSSCCSAPIPVSPLHRNNAEALSKSLILLSAKNTRCYTDEGWYSRVSAHGDAPTCSEGSLSTSSTDVIWRRGDIVMVLSLSSYTPFSHLILPQVELDQRLKPSQATNALPTHNAAK